MRERRKGKGFSKKKGGSAGGEDQKSLFCFLLRLWQFQYEKGENINRTGRTRLDGRKKPARRVRILFPCRSCRWSMGCGRCLQTGHWMLSLLLAFPKWSCSLSGLLGNKRVWERKGKRNAEIWEKGDAKNGERDEEEGDDFAFSGQLCCFLMNVKFFFPPLLYSYENNLILGIFRIRIEGTRPNAVFFRGGLPDLC